MLVLSGRALYLYMELGRLLRRKHLSSSGRSNLNRGVLVYLQRQGLFIYLWHCKYCNKAITVSYTVV